MAISKQRAGVFAASIIAGALLSFSMRSGERDIPKASHKPSYDHAAADHIAPISSGQTERCYDVFPSDSELPPREGAQFAAWHKEHYGTDVRDVQFSSGVNWRLQGQLNGDGIYVSFGECNGRRFERVAYRGKTALILGGAGPIESRIEDILDGMR